MTESSTAVWWTRDEKGFAKAKKKARSNGKEDKKIKNFDFTSFFLKLKKTIRIKKEIPVFKRREKEVSAQKEESISPKAVACSCPIKPF